MTFLETRSPLLASASLELLTERRSRFTGAGPFFPDSRGGWRDRNNVERDFRAVRSRAGFDWVVPHTYRKTVATMLDGSGLSARFIADQLGHSRVSMTQDFYLGRRAVDGAVALALGELSWIAGGDTAGRTAG